MHPTAFGWVRRMEGLCHESEIDSPSTRGNLIEVFPNTSNGSAAGDRLESAAERADGDEFWNDQLAQPPTALQLPLDHLRPVARSFSDGRARTTLDLETSLAARRMSVARGCSLSTTILSTFISLIHRLTGQDDVVIGLRFESGTRETVRNGESSANTANVLPMRSRFESNPRFTDFLEATDRLVRVASENRDFFSGRILERLNLEPSSLFSVLFNYETGENRSDGARFYGALESSHFPGADPRSASISDLYFDVFETNEGALEIKCDYSAELLELETVQRWLGHFRTLLKNVVENPDAKISEIPILTDAERDLLIVDWNRTAAAFPSDASIPELFEVLVAQTPNAIAIEHWDARWTYGELNERANRLAHKLRDAGAGRESLIGICLERSPEMIAGMLAILKVGSAYVPIDADCPVERCIQMLENVSLVVTSDTLAGKFSGSTVRVLHHDDPSVSNASGENLPHASDGRSLAYVIYTSGSSGRPKGVAVEHRGVVRLLRNNPKFITFESSDTVAQILNLAFDASVQEVWGALLNGARLVIIDKEIILSPPRFVRELKRSGVSILNPPVALFNLIASEIPDAFADLKYVVFGGEMADPRTVAAVLRAGPPQHLVNAYGPTETTVAATTLHIGSLPEGAVSVPIGSPISNTTIYVLDRLKNLVPIGVVGEIYIGGPGVARGYIGAPELTGERFIPDPFSAQPDARLYKTGDLAKWLPEGNLEFIGRTDFQIKIRGFRVEPGEIEAILKQYPAARDAVIEVRDLENQGKQIIAYVAGDTSQLSERGIRDFLKACLPHYMVPSAIIIVKEFPLSSNGKVDRRALQQSITTRSENGYVAARDAIEEQLVAIWQKALDISSVGINDDFFELGGHSLTAVRIFSEIEKAHGINLSLATLSEAPTIEKLATALREHNPGLSEQSNAGQHIVPFTRIQTSIPALGSLDSGIPRATSFAQRRLWFIDQLRPRSCEYNLPFAMRISGELNIPALERSFSLLIERHEVLRTTFRACDGEPIQFVAPPQNVTLPITDLRGLEWSERSLIEAAAWIPFDLAEGPLIRASMLRVDDREHVLNINLHHIIFDHWSDKILMDELIEGYKAFSEGREPVLPDLPIQYADYAHWQRDFLRRKEFEEQFRYWCEQLADLPRLQLPTDYANSRFQTSKGANEAIELSRQLADALKMLSRSEKATFFMTVLAAFKVLLSRYTGQDDIVVGSPIADRGRADVAPLIGLFLNTLVLRTKLDGNPTFREVLRRVRHMSLEAYRHQNLPFDTLVEALAPKRDLTQNPLFQVAFVLVDSQPGTYAMGDLKCDRIAVEDRTAKFDLTLMFLDDQDGLHGYLNYNANLFEAETMRRMGGHLSTLLEEIVANPDARISELSILTKREREQLIIDWNRTGTEFPRDACITEIFESRAALAPAAMAVEHETTRWTYRELNERANQLSHTLRDVGAKPGAFVGLCLERSAELIAGMLAILKTGGAYVPIDPEYPAMRRSLMLENVPYLLTTKKLASQFADCAAHVICIDDQSILSAERTNLPLLANGDDLAYVLYTSGSTGKPKGVAIPHRAVNRLVLNTNYIVLDASAVVAQTSNCCFDAATFEIWGALLNGARLVIINKDLALSPTAFVEEIKWRGITTIWLTTSLFNIMAQHTPDAFADMQNVLFGGEAADARSVAAVLKHGAPRHLVNGYGPTETTTFAACYEVHSVPENALTIPIGRPIANTTIYLLDNYRNPVPVGAAGEIYIGGPGLARGYISEPNLTAERFVPDPFSHEPDARLYKTGDLARWLPDGTIDYLGRIDKQIKIRGFRVEPGEIEVALKLHPAVRDAVVEVFGQSSEDKRIVAYLAGKPSLLKDADVREFLKSRLPDYMLPQTIVVLENLPINSNGKIDRRALPAPTAIWSNTEKVLARDSLETQLVAIWEKVLKVHPIGVTDDFFELGGHSLMAVRMFLEIEKTLGKSFPLATLFGTPTIERLAEKVREETRETDWAPVVAVQLQGNRIPFFAIHGRDGNVLFYRKLSECLGKDQPFYALQSQGLDGKPITRTTVEEMAEYYVQEIRKVRPRGPYLLGGYSFGGVVAYEIARRLRIAGEEIAFLVLFDAFNPATPPRLRSMTERIRQLLNDPSTIAPNRLFQFAARRTGGKMGATLLKWNEIFHKMLLGWKAKNERNVSIELLGLHVRMVHESAFQAYRPLPYDGKITLFRPSIHPAGYEFDPDLGWNGLVNGGVEIHIVSGDHDTIFSDENAPSLAEKLEKCIRAAF
jgi:amino acid adenylation domain-containing protein